MKQSADSETDAPAYRWAVLAGVWLLYFCFGLILAAMGPLVAPIAEDLGIGYGTMGAILGAWPLLYIASAVPCGLLLDRLGERHALLIAAFIIGLSGLLRGLATTDLLLFAAVGLFGIGGPLISIGVPKLIARWFKGPGRGTAMGIYITGPSLGGIAALSLTHGLLMPLLDGDWRAVLFLYAGLCFLCGLVWLAIASHPAARALETSARDGERLSLAAFAEILALRPVQIVLVMSVGIFFYNHGLTNWLPEILRSHGMSPAMAGYWAAIPTLVGIAGALLIPRWASPERRLAVMAGLFASALGASLLLHLTQGPGLVAGLLLQGIARSSMMTVAILLLMETPGVPKARLGLAGGLFFTTAEIGGVLGPLTVGLLTESSGDFSTALAVMSAVCLFLLGLIALLRFSPGRES